MDLYEFLDKVSEGRWIKANHLDKIIEILGKLDSNEERFTIINMPPRHGKTQLISIYYPIWYLINNPSDRIIITSYNSTLSTTFGSEILDIIENIDLGVDMKISKRNKSKTYFKLENYKGSMTFVGAGGTLTGKGANLIIVDDPYKNNTEADSIIIREKIWSWFLTTVYTRLEPNGKIIIVMTRWHKDDICGRLIKKFDIK